MIDLYKIIECQVMQQKAARPPGMGRGKDFGVRSGKLGVISVFTVLSEVMFPRCGYMLMVSLLHISDTSPKDHLCMCMPTLVCTRAREPY